MLEDKEREGAQMEERNKGGRQNKEDKWGKWRT
jgi:hypothetical protein